MPTLVDVMLSRLPIRTLLSAAVALMAGFVAALLVLDLAGDQFPGEPLVQIGADYLTWVAVALIVYLLIRRFVPAARRRVGEARVRGAAPGERQNPGDRETP